MPRRRAPVLLIAQVVLGLGGIEADGPDGSPGDRLAIGLELLGVRTLAAAA